MKGWRYESTRHSLAARGIRTRAISLPSDYPTLDATIKELVRMDRWDLSIEKDPTAKYEVRYIIHINPRLIHGVKWVDGGSESYPKPIAVDFNIAHIEEMDDYIIAKLNPDSGYSEEFPGVEDGNPYRGMSWEELQFIKKNGYIRSDCSYNIGTAEEGCTYFSEDPTDAVIYAGNFQPYHMVPNFDHPAYVVKIKKPLETKIKQSVTRGKNEIAISEKIPMSDILEVYEVRPYSIDPGFVELYQKYIHQRGDTVYLGGSRKNPSVRVGYKRLERAI